jgi:hypothetical protein
MVSIEEDISSISMCTISWFTSPSPWYLYLFNFRRKMLVKLSTYFAMMARASDSLPRLINHRGDSGKNHTNTNTMMHGIPWVAMGTLQFISLAVSSVIPYVSPMY